MKEKEYLSILVQVSIKAQQSGILTLDEAVIVKTAKDEAEKRIKEIEEKQNS